jgi:hypothetical protein
MAINSEALQCAPAALSISSLDADWVWLVSTTVASPTAHGDDYRDL